MTTWHTSVAFVTKYNFIIYNFRHPDDTANAPGPIVIKYDNTDSRIILTDDTMTCYVCHQTRHTFSFCKKKLKQ